MKGGAASKKGLSQNAIVFIVLGALVAGYVVLRAYLRSRNSTAGGSAEMEVPEGHFLTAGTGRIASTGEGTLVKTDDIPTQPTKPLGFDQANQESADPLDFPEVPNPFVDGDMLTSVDADQPLPSAEGDDVWDLRPEDLLPREPVPDQNGQYHHSDEDIMLYNDLRKNPAEAVLEFEPQIITSQKWWGNKVGQDMRMVAIRKPTEEIAREIPFLRSPHL